MTYDENGSELAVNSLTARISQILDGTDQLADINMRSAAGRRLVAAYVARQLIDGGGQERKGLTSDPPPDRL